MMMKQFNNTYIESCTILGPFPIPSFCNTYDSFILIMKPTTCINFSNLFLELNSTCFGQAFCPSSGVQYCIFSNGIQVTLTACQQAISITCMNCCVYSTRLLMMDRKPVRNRVLLQNKFEKLVHLVGLITRIYHDARSSEYQNDSFICSRG